MSGNDEFVVIDVWDGDEFEDHIARFLRPVDKALEVTRREIEGGYLVSLRIEKGDYSRFSEEFDTRTQQLH